MREILTRLLDWVRRDRLGNRTRVREDTHERWSAPWLDHLQQDVRYALRGLRRSPGFTAAVVLTLGLGIGANAAMFNVIDQLMFRPFAYLRDPANVRRVYLRLAGRDRLLTSESFPYARYLDLARWTTSFSQYAAFFPVTVAVGTGLSSRERPIAAVSASYFDFFDARPVRGRFFVAEEDTTPIGASVAVLSHAYWTAELGARDVIGHPIQIDNVVYTVIGIAPPGFTGVADGAAAVAYVPITTFGGNQPGGSSVGYWRRYVWDWAEMMVRRKPGVTLAQANADLTQAFIRSRAAARPISPWMPRVETEHPVAIAGALRTAAGPYPGLEARTLSWVTGVAVIVLLIACANVANLLLVRALRRRRETALRLALGVSPRRLAGQALTESLLLSLAGCGAGVIVAQLGGATLRHLFLPAGAAAGVVDWRTLGVALAAALGAGAVTGLAPLLLARSTDITTTLKSGAHEGTHQRSRLRSSLLVMQVVLSVVLLVGAGLFVQSLRRSSDMHLGYDVNPVLLVRWNRRGEAMTPEQRRQLRLRVSAVADRLPSVERTAWVSNVPLLGTSTMALFVPGIDSVARLGRFTYQVADPEYFRAIGTRVVRGRGFTADDRLDAPRVAVVSESMARLLWRGRDALGQCLRLGADTMPCASVVGVVEDAVHDPVEDQPLRYYLPLEQMPMEIGTTLLVMRMRRDAATAVEDVRRTLQAVMPGQQYVTVQPMADLLVAQRRSWRVGATMFVAFGVLALVVAAVGLYGVIAYNVGQRMHEMGVRVALGACGVDVVRLVVAQGVRLAVTGVVVGVALALGAARWIEPLLFRQSATDPAVFSVVGVMLVAVAVVACSVPAARAARADPNTVLRAE